MTHHASHHPCLRGDGAKVLPSSVHIMDQRAVGTPKAGFRNAQHLLSDALFGSPSADEGVSG